MNWLSKCIIQHAQKYNLSLHTGFLQFCQLGHPSKDKTLKRRHDDVQMTSLQRHVLAGMVPPISTQYFHDFHHQNIKRGDLSTLSSPLDMPLVKSTIILYNLSDQLYQRLFCDLSNLIDIKSGKRYGRFMIRLDGRFIIRLDMVS